MDIFDLAFQGMSAFNQLMFLGAGTVLFIIGFAAFGYEIFWRMTGVRVAAEIIGIRATGVKETQIDPNNPEKRLKQNFAKEMYYPVYGYKDLDGQEREYVGSLGSNMIGWRLPGKRVELLQSPTRPDKLKRPGVLAFLFGAMFLIPGCIFFYISLTTFSFSVMTPIVFLMMIGFIAFKLLAGGGLKKMQKVRKAMHAGKATNLSFQEKRKALKKPKGVLLTQAEIEQRLAAQNRVLRISAPITILIGIWLLWAGGYFYNDMSARLAHGLRTEGTVVRVVGRSGSDNNTTYYAMVGYQTEQGKNIEFRDNVGSSSALYKRGDIVTVLYNPAQPDKAIIDRKMWNWVLSLSLFLGGVLVSFAGIFNYIRATKRKRYIGL